MSSQVEKTNQNDVDAVHQHYMDVINAMPNIVYWVDKEGNLKGCNSNFIKLLGLQNSKHLKGTPYQQMNELARWDSSRIEALKLDDMNVLFSGTARHNIEEQPIQNQQGKTFHFQSTRVPLLDRNKEVTGLVVILNDMTFGKAVAKHADSLVVHDKNINAVLRKNYIPSVLMVEDNIIAQQVEKALLTSLHCQVDIADTADIAVELFHPGKYDLVLMDIGLEGSSGYIVAKQLRQKEKDTQYHVPIIALTGYEADAIKYDCQHYFMQGAISKPLTSEQAEQIIKHYVYKMDVQVHGLKSI